MKNFRTKLSCLIMMIMIIVTITACGNKTNQNDSQNTPQITEQATKQPEATKESETETVAPAESIRIVSFSPSITELLFSLGQGDSIVGRTDYCDYPSTAAQIESIGDFYTPDMEKIISLEPDVVIASSLWTEDIAKQFENAGIDVMVLDEASKVSDIYTMIDQLSEKLNCTTEGEGLKTKIQKRIDEIAEKISGLDRKTIYYVVGYGEYGDYTATGETFISDLMILAGGDNIAASDTGWSYSLETLIEKDPEIILTDTTMVEDFMNSPSYQGLSAVKNKQVYGIDKNLMERQTERMVDGIEEVAKIIHPEAFTD